ncbi:MAG: hypothetical protein MJY96_08285 [Bacteroidaceae bacterium]|nr:hypothetical protein [Bacteroidaceae bacterium]
MTAYYQELIADTPDSVILILKEILARCCMIDVSFGITGKFFNNTRPAELVIEVGMLVTSDSVVLVTVGGGKLRYINLAEEQILSFLTYTYTIEYRICIESFFAILTITAISVTCCGQDVAAYT